MKAVADKYEEEYLKKDVSLVSININDRNENTNGHLYPDIRFDQPYFQLIVEVDEFKHRGSAYECDKRRMYEIVKQLGMPCVFIRYNPDDKKSNYETLLSLIRVAFFRSIFIYYSIFI